MSIASEITSIGENLKKDYQSIANLGADLTNVDKNIENIAELLDGVYDRLPKTEFEEGESVTLENTLKGKLDFDDGKVGFGQASQETTKGYQLLDINATSGTKNGATWVVNEDKSITISTSGATTGLVTIPIVARKTLSAGTYYASGVTGGSENTYYFGILSTNWVFRNYNGITQFSVSEESTYSQIWIVIASGTTINTPITIYPMISKTNTSQYEPYTGGYASPSPNWEQEVKCVAGRNKFKGTLYNGIINNSGDYVSNSTRITNSNNGSNSQVYLEKGTYTLSIKDLDYCSVLTKNASGTIVDNYAGTWNTLPFTFNVTSEAYVYISARKSSNADISPSDYNIMLEQGSTATPYLPYNTIEEVVSSNILDLSTLYLHPNNNLRVINNDNELEIKPNTTITIKANAGYNYGYFELDANKQTLVDSGWKDFVTTFTSNSSAKYLRLNLRKSDNGVISNPEEFIKGIGLEIQYSSTYITPTSYQLSLGDIELCKIGTYQDYIYKNGDKWYKHSAIGKIILDGNTNAIASKSGSTYNNLFFTSAITNIQFPTNNDGIIPLCSNYFINTSVNNMFANDITGIAVHSTLKALAIGVTLESGINTKELMNTWLSTHNTTVYYPLLNATDTEITDTTLINQLEALYNAHSNNGTTIITSNGDLPMIIKVRGLKGE